MKKSTKNRLDNVLMWLRILEDRNFNTIEALGAFIPTMDHMDNITIKNKDAKHILLAHYDVVGIFVTHKDEDGLKFDTIGTSVAQLADKTFVNQRTGKEANVVLNSAHLRDGHEEVKITELTLLSEDAEVGDFLVYKPYSLKIGDTLIRPYLDNNISVALALAFGDKAEVVLTSQEEVGCSGAKGVKLSDGIKDVLVLDSAFDVDSVGLDDALITKRYHSGLKLKGGDGLVLGVNGRCTKSLVEELKEELSENDIKHQLLVTNIVAPTDIEELQTRFVDKRFGFIGIPAKGLHGARENIRISDLIEAIKLLEAVLC